MVKKIVDPLKELTEASKKLAEGDYAVNIVESSTYEIKQLSAAFENMTVNLREHEKVQHILAYRDSMTGVRNTTSYKVWVSDFDNDIKANTVEDFSILVLDMNYLKEANDLYGHDVGNRLIITAAQIISAVFKRSPVFRIGGDEFLVVLQHRDLEEADDLIATLDSECMNASVDTGTKSIPISIARGMASFNPDTDTAFIDVFNRADDAMYQHKRSTKTEMSIS
jgi:diguanylate cyclase (GGDEF)-like protein